MGVSRENTILLSKHTVHKVETSYLPEVSYEALLAAAGFDVYSWQEYNISRSYAQVPTDWIGRVFLYINTWQVQVSDIRGFEKGKSARSFVYDLQPLLD